MTRGERFFRTYWWVIAWALLCAMVYERGSRSLQEEQRQLSAQLDQWQEQHRIIAGQKEELQLQINSQCEPAWVELTLMKGLGLVPEGQRKILFCDIAER